MAAINRQRFDLLTLRLFVAVVDAGSLTGGAQRLDLSLAAASKRIAELEAHVGLPLLARGARGVAPTDAGQTLLPHALELVSRLEQLAQAMGEARRGRGGHLRLWANSSAFAGCLPRLLAAYAREHPGVLLDLEDAISEDTVRAVARGVAELGIVGDNTSLQGLQTRVAHVDELVLLLPADHALAAEAGAVPLAAVLDHELVTFQRATSLTRQLADDALALGRTLRLRAQVRSFDGMARMVASGLGLAILPRDAAAPYLRSLGLVVRPLSELRTARALLLVMRDRAALSPAAQGFVELVEQQAGVRSG